MYSLCCDSGSVRCTKGFPFWHGWVFLFVCPLLHIVGCPIHNKAVIFFLRRIGRTGTTWLSLPCLQTVALFHCRFCFFQNRSWDNTVWSLPAGASMKMFNFERKYSPWSRHMICTGKTKLTYEKCLLPSDIEVLLLFEIRIALETRKAKSSRATSFTSQFN